MRKQNKGQGVIEYAGALVIAAVLVGAVLTGGPEQLSELFDTIITSAGTTIGSYLPGADS